MKGGKQMTTRKTQIQINIAAFLLLFTVSLYRQISLRLLPDDPFRTYILYACYLILIGCWIVSIMTRITQKNIRFFLTLEAAIILIALTIRFLQDTFWYENIRLMRISGLCIGATVLPAITCGTFAVLGIGSFDGFRIPKKWFLFDVLEHLLEYEQFVIDRIVICVDQSRICYMVHGETVHSTEAFIRLIDAKGYSISGNDKPHGYEIILTEDGE